MDWINRFNKAVLYIENHLTDTIDYRELAKITCLSVYHFQRMFALMAGIPLSEYIRRRRMSMAAADLLNGSEKIIDIALKYGYASPTAFNRAFQSVHGIAPSAARKDGVTVKAFPSISFKIMIKGVEEMNYKIETKPSFRVVGMTVPLAKDIDANFENIPVFWSKISGDGTTIPTLLNAADSHIRGIFGLCICTDTQDWRYMIGCASTKTLPKPFESFTVPEMTWAVFSGEGACPQAIQELEKRIYTEWLPTSGYTCDGGLDIELYLTPNPEAAVFEVWLPVRHC